MAEGLVYFSAICYSASFAVWGNPNSLGLIMGCICWPVLLWQFILPVTRQGSPRRFIALFLCGALLVLGLSRASMIAALLTSIFLLVGARRYRTLLAGLSLFMAILLNVFLVAPQRFQDTSDTLMYTRKVSAETFSRFSSETLGTKSVHFPPAPVAWAGVWCRG